MTDGRAELTVLRLLLYFRLALLPRFLILDLLTASDLGGRSVLCFRSFALELFQCLVYRLFQLFFIELLITLRIGGRLSLLEAAALSRLILC